jgi:hypothetical protein
MHPTEQTGQGRPLAGIGRAPNKSGGRFGRIRRICSRYREEPHAGEWQPRQELSLTITISPGQTPQDDRDR